MHELSFHKPFFLFSPLRESCGRSGTLLKRLDIFNGFILVKTILGTNFGNSFLTAEFSIQWQ